MNTCLSTLCAALCAGLIAFGATATSPLLADEEAEAVVAAQSAAHERADEQVADKRKAIVAEAQSAIRETRAAIEALDKEKAEEALAALERATGKLEIVIAREPTLALATTGVSKRAYDVVGTVKEIKAARARAETWLEAGDVQKARRMLGGLASEIVVSVTKVPLGTYPDAIKNAAALIDKGKNDEAKAALLAALNTLVITDHVIPLPVLSAQTLLQEAEALAENDNRTPQESETLAKLIERARSELKVAEALGYGGRSDHAIYYAELERIEKATHGQGSGKGLFDKLRDSLGKLRDTLFG